MPKDYVSILSSVNTPGNTGELELKSEMGRLYVGLERKSGMLCVYDRVSTILQ